MWSYERTRSILMNYLDESLPSLLPLVDIKSTNILYQWVVKLWRKVVRPSRAPESISEDEIGESSQLEQALLHIEQTSHHLGQETREDEDRIANEQRDRQSRPDGLSTARISSVDRAQGSMVLTFQIEETIDEVDVDRLANLGSLPPDYHDRDSSQRRSHSEDHRPSALATTAEAAYLIKSLNLHLTAIIGNLILVPLRMLVIQRVVGAFQPSDYSWHSLPRPAYWFPRSRKETGVFCSRMLFCLGLECTARMAFWISEVGVVFWQERRKSANSTQSEVGTQPQVDR